MKTYEKSKTALELRLSYVLNLFPKKVATFRQKSNPTLGPGWSSLADKSKKGAVLKNASGALFCLPQESCLF